MFWKIFNKLFGWQYVLMMKYDKERKMLRRIKTTRAGERYVLDYLDDIENMIFLDEDLEGWEIKYLTKRVKE